MTRNQTWRCVGAFLKIFGAGVLVGCILVGHHFMGLFDYVIGALLISLSITHGVGDLRHLASGLKPTIEPRENSGAV